MPSIDERVVSMAFENQVFEQRVAQTMTTLTKLDTAVKNVGGTTGLSNIEAQANKVTLQGPMSALDRLRAKLGRSGEGAAQGLGEIERAGNRVTLEGPNKALDKVAAKTATVGTHAADGFSEIERASSRVSLQGLNAAMDSVTAKFSVLAGAASVAMGNITSQAISKGTAFAKSFTVSPILDGLNEYQTNLKSIQTIQANTDRPLTEINRSLTELNKYSDQTIYNFSEMAKNIGTFTAAGVDLKTSTSSIKGIANMAALSGSSSQQAATAMYQLSQAISSGRVGLQDWNSVVNAGMGGKKLQNALAQTGIAMGDISEKSVKMEGPMKKLTINGQSFRESIMAKPGTQSWLSSDILVNTLATLDGRFSRAALSAELTKDGLKKYSSAQVEAKIATARTALEQKNGVKYSDEQFEALMKLSDSAFKSATEVKTLGQVFEVAKETIGSGWAASFQSIFGNLKEAKTLFTGMSGAINGFINANALARNKVLHDWKALGGRTEMIEGIKQAFQNIFAVLKPIKDAFRDIFPAKTGRDLFEMSKGFHDLMERLKPSPELVSNLQRIFRGLFAVMHIGWEVIKGVVGVIGDLLGVVGKGSGGFLNFAGGIGDFLVALDKVLTQGGLLKGFFKTLGAVLAVPLKLVVSMAKAIASLFGDGQDQSLVEKHNQLQQFGKVLTPAEQLVLNLKEAWAKLVGAFEKTKGALEPFFSSFVDKLKGFGTLIGDAFKNMDFDNLMSGIQTGAIAGIFLAVRKVLGKGGPLSEITGTLEGVNDMIGAFTGKMEAMQSKLKAEALLAIAGAIAVLAAGLFVLSTIDGEDLAKALTASAIGLGQLMGALKLMTTGMGKLGVLQLPVIAAGMIGLALAVLILSGAMKIFATMSWEDIAKGLVGVAGSIAAVGLSMRLMPPTLPLTAAGLILIGIALNLIAAAMAAFATMDLKELGKGFLGIAVALGGIALGVAQMPPTMPLIAAGLILMGIALGLIGGAIKMMGSLDMLTIIKGLGAIMAALVGIGIAMWLMPPTMPLMAAGLIAISIALNAIGTALRIMGGMDVLEIVKALAAMAGALIVLAVGLTAMSGTLMGSAALLAAAVALAILAPTLAVLGNLSWGTIIKGLVAVALVLGTLSVVGMVASAGLIQLGIALLPLAGVLILVAGSVFLFAKAMQILGAEGGKAVAVMITALTAFVAALPTLVIKFLEGIVGILDEIVKLAPKIIEGLGKILTMVIAFVIQQAPQLALALNALISAGLNVLTTNVPKFIVAGVKIVGALLNGISQNITQVVTKVAEIITKFLNALADKAPSLVAAGARTLIAFLNGITTQIPRVVATVANMVIQFLNALTRQIPRIAVAGQRMMLMFLTAVSNFVPRLVAKGAEIIIKFLDGLGNNVNKIVDKGADLIIKLIQGITRNINKIADKGADAVIKFLNGLAETIRTKGPEIIQAGLNIADALIDGVTEGFGLKGGLIKKALEAVFKLIPGWAKKILGIKSPSTLFAEIGKFTMQGFSKGIDDNAHGPKKAVGNSAVGMINEIKKILGVHSPSEVMRNIGKEVGTGFKQGLEGSATDIRSAFANMRSKIAEDIKSTRDTIKENSAQLKELEKEPRKNAAEIKELRKELQGNRADLERLTGARNVLVHGLANEKQQLIGLSKEYEKTTKQLDEAQKALDEATKARDEAQKSYTDQYSQLPDIDKLMQDALADAELTEQQRQEKITKIREDAEKRRQINQVENYKKALQAQIEATKKYNETLQKLRALGLDDATYKKLLAKGIEGQEFADQLLQAGKPAIDEINRLDAELLSNAANLAKEAAANLYQAGVDAAQGLVDGLKAKQSQLADAMDNLADMMVRSIKRKLGIRSPSKAFADIAKQAIQGLSRGFQDNTQTAVASASKVGTDTLNAISSAMADSIDVDPVITPVLDLTKVQKEAGKLSDITNVTPITAAASFGQATAISTEKRAMETDAVGQAAQAGNIFNYEQNNYSPEKLSDVEIYRQTKNQLAQVKSALGLTS